MSHHPILMSAPMVRAIKALRKTETRRTHGLEKINESPDSWTFEGFDMQPDARGRSIATFFHRTRRSLIKVACPYGAPFGTLWVRETWAIGKGYDEVRPADIPFLSYIPKWYAADGKKEEWVGKTRASIHMPQWVSRLRLEITAIGTERLQDITEAAAQREGADRGILRPYGLNDWQLELNQHARYVDGFRYLWNTINYVSEWERNLWVWPITFKLISLP